MSAAQIKRQIRMESPSSEDISDTELLARHASYEEEERNSRRKERKIVTWAGRGCARFCVCVYECVVFVSAWGFSSFYCRVFGLVWFGMTTMCTRPSASCAGEWCSCASCACLLHPSVCDHCKKWRVVETRIKLRQRWYCGDSCTAHVATECSKPDDWIVLCVGMLCANELARLGVCTVEDLSPTKGEPAKKAERLKQKLHEAGFLYQPDEQKIINISSTQSSFSPSPHTPLS
jgi:hypothetical protein